MESTANLSSFSGSGCPRPPARSDGRYRFLTCGLALPLVLGVFFGTSRAADLFIPLPNLPSEATKTWSPAWGDYDNDGDVDLIVANGAGRSSQRMDLYRNRGDGTFDRMTPGEVGPVVSDLAPWCSVVWADVDNDGFLDLVGTTYVDSGAERPRLYRNKGDGSFHLVEAGDFSQTLTSLWLSSPADLDGDGYVDFLVQSGNALRAHSLYFNRGDNSFHRDLQAPIAKDFFSANADSFADVDLDGDLDVFLANSDAASPHRDRLYLNDGRGNFTSFTNSPLVQTAGLTWHGAWGDYDQDGDFDIILTKESKFVLFRNDEGAFVQTAFEVPKSGGAYWIDYDNDAYLDLFIERAQSAPGGTNSLYHNLGDGTFESVADVVTSTSARRQGLGWEDVDNDGFMDFVEVSPAGGGHLWRNTGNANHWLKLRLKGTASNNAGLGALVRVRATVGSKSVLQMQHAGGSIAFQQNLRPNFGLGDATKADEVRIEWPSGNVQILSDVAADQILTVTEPTFFKPVQPVATINGSIRITNTVAANARQWFFEGAPLDGQTGQILALGPTQTAQAGRYSVVAQTDTGPQTHHVFVRVLSQFTKILDGPVVTNKGAGMSATWFDYDNDGSADLFVANSDSTAIPYVLDALYHNQGDGTFVKVGAAAFPTTPGWSWSGSPGDFDNDGDLDLFVNQDGTASGADQLYLNNGNGAFRFASGQPFNLPGSASQGGFWADYDLDGDLDIFAIRGDRGQKVNDALYRNNGDGTFTTVAAAEAGAIVTDQLPNWTAAWLDYDADGAQDLVVAYAGVGTRLYHNERNGSFASVPSGSLASAQADGSIAPADYDNDGWPDLFVTSWESGKTALHRNLGNGTFADLTLASGIKPPPTSAATVGTWADFDNDGFIDLFLTGTSTNALYRNRGNGTFQSVDVGNLISDGTWGSVGAWADYDNNGFPDLYLVIGDRSPYPSHLYRNNGNGNHWLKIKLVGTTSNRDGLGAKVRVQAAIGGRTFWQCREISGNAGFSGGGALLAHFGLGNATRAATLRVEWPSGVVQKLVNVTADQFLTVTEPALTRLAFTRVADGLLLVCRGETNTPYALQTSSNLTVWSTTQTLTTDATGAATTTTPVDSSVRFYRVANQ